MSFPRGEGREERGGGEGRGAGRSGEARERRGRGEARWREERRGGRRERGPTSGPFPAGGTRPSACSTSLTPTLTRSTSSATRHFLEPSRNRRGTVAEPSSASPQATRPLSAGTTTRSSPRRAPSARAPRPREQQRLCPRTCARHLRWTCPRVGHSIDDADPMTTLKKLSTLFDLPCPPSLTPPAAH